MQRDLICKFLDLYATRWLGATPPKRHQNEDSEIYKRFREFVNQTERCFENQNLPGHITGSALVVSSDFQRVLLTLHKKLGFWLQLGGHSDGEPDTAGVALREAQEESGLERFTFGGPCADRVPFDLDIHPIPARGEMAAHYHYDVRYILIANSPENNINASEESDDLRWFTVAEAKEICKDRSMQRQFEKLETWLAAHPPRSAQYLGISSMRS